MSRIYAPEPAAAALRLSAVAQALAEAGADVTVITTTVPGMRASDQPAGNMPYKVRRAPALRDKDGYIRGYLNYMSFDVPAFFRLVFAKRFDAVIVEPPPTTGVFIRAAAWLRRTPYVFYAADVWSEAAAVAGTAKGVVSIVGAFERWVYRGAARVLSVSKSVTRRVLQSAPEAKVETVGNGYDAEVFKPDGPRVERAPYLLYAGTASEVHGARVFVEAMPLLLAEHPAAQLVFIGQGAEWSTLKAAAAALPDGAVTFLPRKPPTDTAAWIRSARATLASVRVDGYEAFPTKMYASAGCGTPVVYSGVGEGADFIRGLNAGWCVGDDVVDVAAAMIDAFSRQASPEDRLDLADRTRRRFSLHAVGSRVTAAVEAVIR